jgi:NitT/TauT family transport system substrate-binding protein
MSNRAPIGLATACAAGLAACVALLTPHDARAQLAPLTVFLQPSINSDSIWMADAKGLFKAEGLDVALKLFPSGTTSIQSFKAGAGDIILTGDLPALQYWQNGGSYRVIAPIARDAKSYILVTKKEITSAKAMEGRTIATRVGSTGSWFIAEYIAKNGLNEQLVKVRNLDPPLMPAAICRGDIDAFFIWQPSPAKALQICGDKVHYLTTAEGYVKGYSIAGARPEWLATPEGADKTKRFLRAVRKGAEMAAADQASVVEYLNKRFGLTEQEVMDQRAFMERVLKMDATFFEDFCSENRWQQRAGMWSGPSDLSKWVWGEGLQSIDPSLVVAAPPPC